jgi:hypothetical protein
MLKYVSDKFINHIDELVEEIGNAKVRATLKQHIISSID